MSNLNSIIRLPVVKMAGNGLLLQTVFFLIAVWSIANKNAVSTQQFWLVCRYCVILGLVCYVCIICYGVISRRAFSVHFFFLVSVPLWITPLALAGFELSGKNIPLLSLIVVLCLANAGISFIVTFNKINLKDSPVTKSGRLDIKNGMWDLNKHLIVDESRSASESIAKILIPLGAVLGTFLFRKFPGQGNELATLFNFTLAVMITNVMGIHIAICRYILLIENKINKYIQVS